ncbi:MAG: ATP-dependent zinc metalloprotease FtsH, partial [Candidatus Uhrbacteria bacterium]
MKDGSKAQAATQGRGSVETLLGTYGVTADQLKAANIEVKKASAMTYVMNYLLPTLFPIALLAIFFLFMLKQMQGANSKAMSFGQSGAKEITDKKQQTKFADVAGALEAKEELGEIVEFLKNPKKFSDLGAKIPKGVLLMGPPGTGKTLLTRAVAGEADVPFFYISGSEFVEMFVGVGASRVRDLFSKAKKSAPCIIFIDEIDAVGRQRGSGLGGSHDEREQTLNQILTEMDGFEPNTGVIIIAATNRPDVLDPALLRPGRFDRRVTLDLPDIKDREAILTIHGKNKPLTADVDLHRVAQRTVGFSGADLGNLMNEAAIRAGRRNAKEVTGEDVLTSIEKVLLGPERKSHVMNPEEKRVTSYHEAGHALVAQMLPDADPVHKVSIISRGSAGGYTMKLPSEDRTMHKRKQFLADLAMSLGGYVAEQETFGDITTGASDDLKRCNRLARELVVRYGMSDLGPRTFGERDDMPFLGKSYGETRNYSEKTAEAIDAEVTKLVVGAMEVARGIIRDEKAYLDKIAEKLLAEEVIEKDAFDAIFAKA